jgi:hypothetical protein
MNMGYIYKIIYFSEKRHKKSEIDQKFTKLPPMSANFPAKKDNLVIEVLSPLIEHGKYAVHREPGDAITVQADIFRHSHEKYAAAIEFKHS